MKKIELFVIPILTALLFCSHCPTTCYAYEYSTEERIIHYLSTDKGKAAVVKEITETVNNSDGFQDINGTVDISQPFDIPFYNYPTDKIMAEPEDIKYSACFKDGKLIGLLRYMYLENKNDFLLYYMILPENLPTDDFSFITYKARYTKDGSPYFGQNLDNNRVFVVSKDSSMLVYYGKNDYTNIDLKAEINENYPKFNYKEICRFNSLKSFEKSACSINISDCTAERINENSVYAIVSAENGLALTYKNGRYYLAAVGDEISGNQKFIIRESSVGYTISPLTAPNKKISVRGNKQFNLSFAYFGKTVCRIFCADNSERAFKSDKNAVSAADYNGMDMAFDWLLKVV